MAHLRLYDFQEEALNKLFRNTEYALDFEEDKRILLKSPTGSGKTIIMGSYIDKVIDEIGNVAFVWICETPNLTLQSKDKLSKFFDFTTRTFDESRIQPSLENRSVTFINWEKIKENRIGTKTGDVTTSLVDLCIQTKSEGKKVIFIIDEAHTNANSKQSKEQVKLCNPDVIVDVTATPNAKREVDREVEIDIQDVQDEEIIKSSVVLNYDQSRYNDDSYKKKHGLESFKDFIIYRAIELREQMEKEIKEFCEQPDNNENPYVPLLLIQIPPKSKHNGDVLPELEAFLETKGYVRGENLAVYQSDDYSDELENIGNDERYKILIFKSAIAKGWDCPRASIITMLRDPKTKSFTTQTIGRIMRVPRLEYFPGKYSWLNKGYIYIESTDNKIINEYIKNIEDEEKLKAVQVELKKEYKGTKIAIQTKRWDNKYTEALLVLEKVQNDLLWKLEREGWLEIDKEDIDMMKENNAGEIDYKDIVDGKYKVKKETIKLTIKDRIARYNNAVRTMKINKDVLSKIEDWLLEKYNFDEVFVYDIVYTFREEIDRVYAQSFESHSKPTEVRKKQSTWSPVELKEVNSNERREDLDSNYIYAACYGKFNGLEEKLAHKLAESDKVKYWVRNDDSGRNAFAIPYVLNNKYRHFHPDFIANINNTIHILETKGQDDKEESHIKYQSLKELEFDYGYKVGFIKEINKKLYIYDGNDLSKDYGDLNKWKEFKIV